MLLIKSTMLARKHVYNFQSKEFVQDLNPMSNLLKIFSIMINSIELLYIVVIATKW